MEQHRQQSSDDDNVTPLHKKPASAYSPDERNDLVEKIDGRGKAVTVQEACNNVGIKTSQYYQWKKDLKQPPANRAGGDDIDDLVDQLLVNHDLDQFYESWRQRAVTLLESDSPAANRAGQLIDQLLYELAERLGWDFDDE